MWDCHLTDGFSYSPTCMATRDKIARNMSRKRRFYRRKNFWIGLALVGFFGALIGWIGFKEFCKPFRLRAEAYDLERINDLEAPSLILDRNNKEIGRIFVQNRSIIPYDKIPAKLIKALEAGEDSRFQSHHGVDYIGVLRAVKSNASAGERNQGASTITQQLARNAYPLKEESKRLGESDYKRKIVEAYLSVRIETRYSKQQILEFYLNRIYFGSGFHGIRSASLGYFGKEPEDLSVEECASIIGLIKNPTGLSPLNNPEGNRKSRDHVLDRMREEGSISVEELARYKLIPLKLDPKPLQRGTSHLYERVADEIRQVLGDDAMASGGFKVHTTIMSEAQAAAQEALQKSLTAAEARPGYANPKYADYRKSSAKPAEYLQGAVLLVDHQTGDVLAHVGGRDYAQVPFDFIEMGRRPLGTAFFPFLYAAGLSGGMTPATLLADEQMDNRAVMIGGREGVLGEWGMEIGNPTYEGQIPVRRALESSKIAASVRFGQQAGFARVAETATAMGLPMKNAELLPRICLGWDSVSMKEAVRAIATFGRKGDPGPSANEMHYCDWIENASGAPIWRRARATKPAAPAIDAATSFQIHSMLAGSLARGSSSGALPGLIERPFLGGGKGGTGADFADTWFLGYNTRIACGVWTGFLQNSGRSIYPGAFSRDLSMPVWQAVMNAAAPSFGGEEIKPPDEVVNVPVCRVSGQRATQFCYERVEDPATGQMRSRSASIQEYFRKGTESLPFCPLHSGADAAYGGALSSVPMMDALPVRPKSPVLVGDDPYHSEQPEMISDNSDGASFRHRTNVLDSLDLGDREEQIHLPVPKRLKIGDD
jgi:membrane peptidoglycan carboxypeptidase